MADEQKLESTQVEQPKKEENLATRVSQFKTPHKEQETTAPDIEKFDYKELNDIKTPEEAKIWAEKAYKSMQSDYGKKTQSIAEQKRELESLQQKLNEASNWTPERIQTLLKDQNFVAAAQSVMESQNRNTDDWSTLTDEEKQLKVQQQELQREIQALKQQSLLDAMRRQDEQLKSTYANYDPQRIDSLYRELMNGKRQATREDLFKILDYDDGLKRAYELGRRDEIENKQEKIGSFSYSPGVDMAKQSEIQDVGKPESNENFINIFQHNLSRLKEEQLRK